MNKQGTKICQECQQEINEKKLKEKWQKEIVRLYQSSGQNKDIDKNSSEVIERVYAWKTEGDNQNNLSTEFGICFGCDE
ncbi:12108_t:CDS:2 [Entrophospora sp. SA101]|nr:12108_t:CDS:2 [Entrophospora sp. SA101]